MSMMQKPPFDEAMLHESKRLVAVDPQCQPDGLERWMKHHELESTPQPIVSRPVPVYPSMHRIQA